MANLPNNPFAELRNLETRVDQRLDILSRAEANLKTLLESLRTQVATAFPVVDQLNKLLPEAKLSAEQMSVLPSIGELSAALAIGMDQARAELEDQAGEMRKTMIEELQTAVQAGRNTLLSIDVAQPSRADLDDLIAAFRVEAQDTLAAVREGLADQLDLLPSDAKLRVEPVLNEIDASRRQAEASVRSVAESAQADMRRRAEQLRQSIDEISVVLEQRLTQRTTAMHQRAEAALAALKPQMDERLDTLLVALEQTIQTRERELLARIDAYPQRLDRQLAEAEAMLMARMARSEKHAADMTLYLENKLTARVDELVGRLRLRLQQELSQVAGTPTPEPREPKLASYTPDARPTLEASLFVSNARRPNLTPGLSPAA
ncbi:MAG TPA: hypothetical protein VF595_01060 [Tepidisphaeraceae bacterium]|jgi:hypothetical protein